LRKAHGLVPIQEVAVHSPPPWPEHRTRQWRAAHLNGALWALGNGLVSTTLITYLAKDYGATNLQVGLILACPHLAGVLRLLAPWLLRRWPDRRRFSLVAFLVSGLCLTLLPWLSWPGVLPRPEWSLTALIALWAAWHVGMYVGLVGFLSWLADLAPPDRRGFRFGVREACLTGGTIAGTAASAIFTQHWNANHPRNEQWIGLALCAGAGAVLVLLSVAPLMWMQSRPRRIARPMNSGCEMLAALLDRRFLPLLAFNVWFSFANGFTGAAIGIYPYAVLHLAAPTLLFLATYMRIGQVIVGPLAGWSLDRFGYRGLMAGSQGVVSCGLLFYLLSTPEQWWWLVGAWTCWIAYAVLNVGLPALTLQLSPGGNSPAYLAVIMAASGISFACASVLGGGLLDVLRHRSWQVAGGQTLDAFGMLFVIGFALRLASALWLLLLPARVHNASGPPDESLPSTLFD
jgi:MFS family permease